MRAEESGPPGVSYSTSYPQVPPFISGKRGPSLKSSAIKQTLFLLFRGQTTIPWDMNPGDLWLILSYSFIASGSTLYLWVQNTFKDKFWVFNSLLLPGWWCFINSGLYNGNQHSLNFRALKFHPMKPTLRKQMIKTYMYFNDLIVPEKKCCSVCAHQQLSSSQLSTWSGEVKTQTLYCSHGHAKIWCCAPNTRVL